MFKRFTYPLIKDQTLTLYASWVSFLALLSQIYLPLWPVPITAQTLAFLLLGLYNSPKQTFYMALSYVLVGIVGFPVFHGLHGGIAYLTSPTFGYILGFPLIAIIFSTLKSSIQGPKSFYIIAFLSIVPDFILGIAYLSYTLGFNASILFSGLLIFIPGEILKITIAYTIYLKGFSK